MTHRIHYQASVQAPALSWRWLALALLLCGCGASRTSGGEPRHPHAGGPGLGRTGTWDARKPQPLTVPQLVEVGSALAQRGDTVRAEQYWARALAQGAEPDQVMPRLLAAYVRDGQYRLAVQRAELHLQRHPRALGLRLLAGTLHGALGAHQDAIRHYAVVVEHAPHSAYGHFALATALLQQGHDRPRADAHFRQYLALDPRGPYAEQARDSLLTDLAP